MSYDDEYRNAFADSTSASDDPFAANPFADMQSSSIAVVPSPRTPGNDAADQATPVYETANAFQPTDFTSPPTPSTAFPTPVLERHHPGVTPFEPLPTVDNAPDDLASPFASTLSIDGHVEAAPKQALDMSALLGDLDQPTTFAKPATKEAGMPSLGRKPVGGALASLLGVEPDARELEREKERRRIQSELLAQKKLASATKASTQAQQTPLPSSRPESVMSDHASSSDSHSYSQPPQHAQQTAPSAPMQAPSRPAPSERTMSSSSNVNKALPVSPPSIEPGAFKVTVGDPHKVGSVGSQHVLYTVRTVTSSLAFRKKDFSVLRRFSHFLWLFDALTSNNPGVIVPGMPEKSALGRFDRDFIESRRQALQAAVSKIVAHPLLVGDPDLRLFLESDSFDVEIKQRKLEDAGQAKGLMASLTSFSSSSKYVETDEFFLERKRTIDQSETQLKAVSTAFDSLHKSRSQLRTSLLELNDALLVVSSSDLSSQLRGMFEKLAILQKRVCDVLQEQDYAEHDAQGVANVIDFYARSNASVRLVFDARGKTFLAAQQAEMSLAKVQAAHEKARRGGYLTQQSNAELAEAQRHAIDARHEHEDVSRLVRTELARYDKDRIREMRDALRSHLDETTKRQHEVVRLWTEFRDSMQTITNQNA